MASRDSTTSTSSGEERRPLFSNRAQSLADYRRNRRANLSRVAPNIRNDDATTTTNGENTRPLGWMSNQGGRGMGLTEAFNRVDDTEDLIPRKKYSSTAPPATWTGRATAANVENTRPVGWMSNKGGRGMGLTEAFDRVDDTEDFIPRQPYLLSAAPATRNENATGTMAYESEDTGLRDTSPSPGPRYGEGLDEFDRRRALERDSVRNEAYFERRRESEERDQAYHEKSLKNTRPRIVGAHGPSKIMGTTRALERKASENSLDEREPPITIPSTWGSRAKKNREWMKKILSPDTSQEFENPLEASEAAIRPPTASDVILPSIEDRSLTQEITPPSSRPASAQPMNSSPEKMWDAELDFTAQSLQISTSPQLRVRSTSKLDDIRAREIQTLTARAVATNRLEEIRERNSEERSLVIPTTEEYHEKTIIEEEGYPIPNTPITVFGNKDWDDYVKRNNVKLSSSNSAKDSHDLLKRLSRSLSASPKISDPAEALRSKEESRRNEQDTKGSDVLENLKLKEDSEKKTEQGAKDSDLAEKLGSKEDAKKNMEHDPEERIAAEARLFEPQDRSDKGSIRAPSPAEDFDETPRPKPDPLSRPTPRVTGAYIDTPLTTKTRSRSPRRRTREYKPSSRFRDSRPSSVSGARPLIDNAAPSNDTAASLINEISPLINTAKHVSAAEDMRRIRLESNVEDSTLDNLDFLQDPPTVDETTTIEPVLDLECDDRGIPLSQKEIDRRIEEITLERMNKSLKATSTSIRDARKGIERLEKQVSSSLVSVAQTQPSGAATFINININLPVPKLWISQPSLKSGMKPSWKFTKLGLLLFAFILWYILESAMCAKFCHPTNSRVNTWQPSDPFFPWTLPTKLDQWTGGVTSSCIGNIADSFGLQGAWIWNFGIPDLPTGYKGGPVGASDWWIGKDGPIGIRSEEAGNFADDEMIV